MLPRPLQLSITILLLISFVSSTPLWVRRDQNERQLFEPRVLADYLLPTHVIPEHYDVWLYPYLENPPERNFTFDGRVYIQVRVDVATSEIVMHAYDVTVKTEDIIVTKVEGSVPVTVVSSAIADNDTNFFVIKLESSLEVGAMYVVDVTYEGVLNKDLEGFYRSTYNDSTGAAKWMAVTHFQANGARRAFPCFDQPDMKASFTVNMAREPGHSVLANTPVDSEGDPVFGKPGLEDWQWVHFKRSPRMSTYLVAFSVNQFASVTNADPRFRVWARPEAVGQAAVANKAAPQAIAYMEKFTKIDYSPTMAKLDQIAIPDFASGAMENWGLVTYRETYLLYEEGQSTSSNKQGVVSIVAHELSHQWFGDLVTPVWWDNLWLNEGFATYFEYHTTAQLEPTWQLEQQFVLEQLHTVLQSDARESTHPMIATVDDPSSINGIFDDITYNKGGCMVRMLITLMGLENFKTGINAYLTSKTLANAVPDDLWAGLQTAVPGDLLPEGVDLKDVMDTWTVQAGYPVVSVTRDYAGATAKVTQERFYTLRDPATTPTEVWWVPLTMTSAADPEFVDLKFEWSQGPELTLDLPASSEQWVIFNVQQFGYYRVNYDATNWGLLASALNDHSEMSKIHVVNRGQLVDDALALARAGLLDYDLALDTTEYLGHETEYHPWAVALTAMGYLNDRLNYEEESRELFEWYMLEKLGPAYSLVNGFTVTEDDSHVMRLKRSVVLKWACLLGDEECNAEAASLFGEWQGSPGMNPIAPDLKSVVYCAGMREGGQAQYDFLFAQYEASSNLASEQALIITALGCSSDTKLLEDYLSESIVPDSRIRSQDARSVLTAVYNNRLGVDIALDFLLNHFSILKDIYGGFGAFNRVFSGIAAKLNTQEHKTKLEDFYSENEAELESEVKSAVQAAIQTVDETLQWHAEHRDTVVGYLRDKGPASGAPSLALGTLLLFAVVTSLVAA